MLNCDWVARATLWFLYGFARPDRSILTVSIVQLGNSENTLICCCLIYFVQVNIACGVALSPRGVKTLTHLMLDFLERTCTSICLDT